MECSPIIIDCRLKYNFRTHLPKNTHSLRRLTTLCNSNYSTLRLIFNNSIISLHTLSRQFSSKIAQFTQSSDHHIFCRNRFMWFRSFDISRNRISYIIIVYSICLNLVVEAHAAPFTSLDYACEDVQTYYAGTEHLRGEPLKRKLNSIITKHHSLSYSKVWDALKVLDAADVDKPETSSGIVEIYSMKVVSKLLAGKPEGWNREHLWPRSYGLTNGPSLTDLHNIRPADVNVNSSRGNKYYGECQVDAVHCLKPATKEAASDTETDKKRWAPPLQVRGDIARALMYMAVSYGSHQSGGGLDLHLSDSPSIGNREMGLLSTLLKWNEIDPPSREEKLRNERICRLYQHNRNPFVDHPEYASLIWKQVVPSHQSSKIPLQKARVDEFATTTKGKIKKRYVESLHERTKLSASRTVNLV